MRRLVALFVDARQCVEVVGQQSVAQAPPGREPSATHKRDGGYRVSNLVPMSTAPPEASSDRFSNASRDPRAITGNSFDDSPATGTPPQPSA